MAKRQSKPASLLAEKFPRGTVLPGQSPLFWAQQKDRYLRQLLIRDIEAITGRRFVVFFGNRFVADSGILQLDVARMAELLGDCNGCPTDLMLETAGGETNATEAIISLLAQVVSDLRVVVANAAKSNGTLVALHAREIVMGPTSELGPVEPSIGDVPCSTLLKPEVKTQNFVLHTAAHHVLRQSEALTVRGLAKGMMAGQPEDAIRRTAAALTTRDTYPVHGSVIDRVEAAQLGLKVLSVEVGDPFWDRIWLLHCMYDHDMRRDGLAKIFEGNNRSLAVAAPK